jgi:hypothetical protein
VKYRVTAENVALGLIRRMLGPRIMNRPDKPRDLKSDAWFNTTHWSLVLAAGAMNRERPKRSNNSAAATGIRSMPIFVGAAILQKMRRI